MTPEGNKCVDRKDFKILVADDDDIALDVVAGILSREGYAIVPARNGAEAISAISEERPGLVITDLRMPGADGIEVLKKAVSLDPHTAVVILTAFGTLDTTLEAMRLGAYDYLTKPFKAQEIAIVADRAFKRAVLIRENEALKDLLRGTYLDIAGLYCRADKQDAAGRSLWLARIEDLEALAILTGEEAGLLKERLVMGNGKGDSAGN